MILPEVLLAAFKLLAYPHEPSPKHLFSCLLVCRAWCRVAVPLLWAAPFSYTPTSHSSAENLITTYLACGGDEARNAVGNDLGFVVPTTVKPATFPYPSFLKEF